MAEHSEGLTGPDFTKGIELTSISPGGLIAGHAFGEPVLLVHVEPNWFAVGGKCTHYGATLADGLLVGETIRCPWHHACFNLRNGAASCAPALNDLTSYGVVIENNVVRVTGKRDLDQLHAGDRPRGSRAPESVLVDEIPVVGPTSVFIVGASAAGIACAEMLRREGYRGPITLADRDPDAPYDRPNLSKDYLAGNAPEEWLPLHPRDFFEKQSIRILSGVEVATIDTDSRTVRLGDGTEHEYGALLISTGASPIRLALQGGERIRYLRTLADCRAIIGEAEKARTAVVIGSSFIGLEVSASLVTRGLEVHVVAPEALPLKRVLGIQLGELIKDVHERRGVRFHLGRTAQAIDGKVVVLDDGTRLDADLVVAGIGVRPNLELAERAGIALDRGIVVNEFLETSVSNVFAAGDVARWPDAYSDARLRVEHWVVAERQGQVVARNMLGYRDRFDDIPFFWSAHYDELSIRYTGHVESWDETKIDGNMAKLDCAVSYMVGGKRRAMATINRDRESLEAELDMERELLLKSAPSIRAESSPA
ncbi:MAG TPA: FAD-dependent oxidoreductase [Gemmatimonadaceae bacterium]|nr:FAD-dependent oxidoreductase [Gemmatimonadaceae bacterium]